MTQPVDNFTPIDFTKSPPRSPSYELENLYEDYFFPEQVHATHLADSSASTSGQLSHHVSASPRLGDAHGSSFCYGINDDDVAQIPENLPDKAHKPSTAPVNLRVHIVHVSEKLQDPLWLIPSRPAPKPPKDVLPSLFKPMPPAIAPRKSSVTASMKCEVDRLLFELGKQTELMLLADHENLVSLLQKTQHIGDELNNMLSRLDRCARTYGGYDLLVAVLPTTKTALCNHMEAVIAWQNRLPSNSIYRAMFLAAAANPTHSLKLLIHKERLFLPLAHASLIQIETGCNNAEALLELSLLYRAISKQANALPPGGDTRLQWHLPSRIYTLQMTPGQAALLWQSKANSLFGLSQRLRQAQLAAQNLGFRPKKPSPLKQSF